jgi:HD-like signal output (HDOD) protein
MASQPATRVTFQALDRLPPFPPVACRLLQQLSSDHTDFRKVADLISSDASLASQVLRLANSALIASRHQIQTIFQATAVIGVDRLRTMVATIAMRAYSRTGTAAEHSYWRHNLASALLSDALSEYFSIEGPVGYTAGLLHDIGHIAMSSLLGEKYDAIVFERGIEVHNLERERLLFGADHASVGGYLAERWQFPDDLCFCMAHHHDTFDGEYAALSRHQRVVRLLQATEKAEALLGFYESEADNADVIRIVPLSRDECEKRLSAIVQSVLIKINATESCLG